MTKETANIIKSITASQKAYREQLINLVFDLIDSALNRHNEDYADILLSHKVTLVEQKASPRVLSSLAVNIADKVVYHRGSHQIQVIGENESYEDVIIGDFSTMPIGMVEEVVKAIIETAKSE